MTVYFLRVPNGRYAAGRDVCLDLPGHAEARAETIDVWNDLVGAVSSDLRENCCWQMELLDEAKRPLFRISLAAETLQEQAGGEVVR